MTILTLSFNTYTKFIYLTKLYTLYLGNFISNVAPFLEYLKLFFTEMRPLTRDIIVSGIPWDTEKQEIIEHFEVNNFLLGKVDEG